MRLQRKTKRTMKYSEMETVRHNGKHAVQRADEAVEVLLIQGYALVSSKNINAVTKVIKALREMNMEFTLRTFRSEHDKTVEDYEFTLPHFEDDRSSHDQRSGTAEAVYHVGSNQEQAELGNVAFKSIGH